MEKHNSYHLVLEARPGEFMPIDINLLINDQYNNYLSLQAIDSFTKKYSEKELFKMITDSNIAPHNYLEGTLKIINENKYRFPVLYKETTFSFDIFFIDNINNKIIMNKFLNIYLKYSKKDKRTMQQAIKNHNINEILNLLFALSYENVRSIYTYISNNVI